MRKKVISLIILIMLLPVLQFSINAQREELVPTGDVYDAVTPGEFIGTLMLGGFRGIAVDVLWIRADKLQRAGRYFELILISDMIAKLQPHDRMVWEFMSWNRAYNVSVMFNDREDRWKWVLSGLEHNMEGISRMPDNWKLYRHLGFMFMHKGADYQEEIKEVFGKDTYTLAREYYQKAIDRNPDVPLFVRRGVIHTYEKQGDFKTALKLYDEHLQTYEFDQIAVQNRDEFLKEKEQYQFFLNEIAQKYMSGDYEGVVEIYEDNIVGLPYLLPTDAIDQIVTAYTNTDTFENGIRFLHRVMNMRMEDQKALYAVYDAYIERYNAHFTPQLEALSRKGAFDDIITLYKQKFEEKKVEISLQNGIMVLHAMSTRGFIDDLPDLLTDLRREYDSQKLEQFRKILDAAGSSSQQSDT